MSIDEELLVNDDNDKDSFRDQDEDDRAVKARSDIYNRDVEEPHSKNPDDKTGEKTIEVPRQEFEELKETVDKLKDLIDPEAFEAILDDDRKTIPGHIRKNQDAIKEVRQQTANSGKHFEPDTKKGKAKKAIVKNWSEWSYEMGGRQGVKTKVSSPNRKQTRQRRRPIQKYLQDELEEKYDEDIQHREVYRVLEELGDNEGFNFEKDGTTRLLFKDCDTV